jgi:hypothetical protein
MVGEEVHVILGQYIASAIKNADAWTVENRGQYRCRLTRLP